MESIYELKALLEDPAIHNVLILPHNMPDGDTLGSCIGVYYMVKHFNKRGYIVINDDIPSNLSFLFDEEVKCYQLSEVEDINFELSIAVDAGETKLFEDRYEAFKASGKTVCIDHHKTNSMYAGLNIVEVAASSTGEIVYQLMKAFECPINATAGQGLYAAIVTDTGSFRYTNTRSETFTACSELIQTGFDFNRLNVEIFQNKSYEKVLLLNKVFETLDLYGNHKIAVVKLSQELIKSLNLSEYDTDGIVEFVRDIKGIEVVVFIRHLGGVAHKVSMRSKHNVDVSEVAMLFHGGGHTKAAGFKMDASIDLIEEKVVEALLKVI